MGISQEEYLSGVPFPTTGDLADPGILKEMEISDHLTCLLRNMYADQEATVRNGHETISSVHRSVMSDSATP